MPCSAAYWRCELVRCSPWFNNKFFPQNVRLPGYSYLGWGLEEGRGGRRQFTPTQSLNVPLSPADPVYTPWFLKRPQHPLRTKRKGFTAIEDVTVKMNNLESSNVTVPLEESVKLIEKCLNNMIDPPVSAPLWLPTDIKSNILKAQVEANQKSPKADLPINDQSLVVEDTSTRNFENQEVKESKRESTATPSAAPTAEKAPGIKTATEDLDRLLESLTENLIDLTDTPPPITTSTTTTPRWLIPSGVVSNGHLGGETSLPAKVQNNVINLTPTSVKTAPSHPAASTSTVLPKELPRPRCLLTTEL